MSVAVPSAVNDPSRKARRTGTTHGFVTPCNERSPSTEDFPRLPGRAAQGHPARPEDDFRIPARIQDVIALHDPLNLGDVLGRLAFAGHAQGRAGEFEQDFRPCEIGDVQPDAARHRRRDFVRVPGEAEGASLSHVNRHAARSLHAQRFGLTFHCGPEAREHRDRRQGQEQLGVDHVHL